MIWLCRPIPWKRRQRRNEQQQQQQQQQQQDFKKGPTRWGKGKLGTQYQSSSLLLSAPPGSPMAASKNEQSLQHTKNETTITTSNQSENDVSSQSVVDPCGIPLEIVRRDVLFTKTDDDDDVSMMSCSIMRSCSDPLEAWVGKTTNIHVNSFQLPSGQHNPKWGVNSTSSQDDDDDDDGDQDDDDHFTRVSI